VNAARRNTLAIAPYGPVAIQDLAVLQSLGQSDLPDKWISRIPVKPSCEKYSSFVFRKFMIIVAASRLGKRGGRVVTNASRDAMDADHIVGRAM
jgi:hypothetical protein